jgi:hypothetical protein
MALKKPKNEVASNGDEAVPGRYWYRPANEPEFSFWRLLAPGSAPLNTRAGHDRLISEFNQGKECKWVWHWEEVLRCDFDYPSFLAPNLGAEHIALCIWVCLYKEDGGIPLADWLKTLAGRTSKPPASAGGNPPPDGGGFTAIHILDGPADSRWRLRVNVPGVLR